MGTDYFTSNLSQKDTYTPTASFFTNADRQQEISKQPKRHSEQLKHHSCVYCGEAHTPTNCKSVTDQQQRMDIIRRDMLCFNCLGHHKISQCKSKYRCRNCNRCHHTSVCNNTTNTDKPISPTSNSFSGTQGHTAATPTANTTSLTTVTTHPRKGPTNHTCLLKTAVATVTSLQTEAEGNILFDEGSQRSFLTQELADALSLQPHHKEDIHLSSFGSKTPLNKKMDAAQISIRTRDGNLLPISVLIVPSIAAPLRTTPQATDLPYLHGL